MLSSSSSSSSSDSSKPSNETKKEYSPRTQYKAISFITSEMDRFGHFTDDFQYYIPQLLKPVFRQCQKVETPDISVTTLQQWWEDYIKFRELPHLALKLEEERVKNPDAVIWKISDEEELILKRIAKDNYELSLDEIALAFGDETGKYIHYKTVFNILSEERDEITEKIDRNAPFFPAHPGFQKAVEEMRKEVVVIYFTNWHGDLHSSQLVHKDYLGRFTMEEVISGGNVDHDLHICFIDSCSFHVLKKDGSSIELSYDEIAKMKVSEVTKMKDIDEQYVITVMKY